MKRQNQLNIKRGLLSKLVLLVALFLGNSNAWGDYDPLTIYDGSSTHYHYPFSNSYVKSTEGVVSEFIVNKDDISRLAGKVITSLTFYSGNKSQSYTNGVMEVYLEEVSSDSYSPYASLRTKDATVVYTGSFQVTDSKFTVVFSNEFPYSGEKNLIIGTKILTKSSTNSSSLGFIGISGTTTSYCSAWSYAKNALPKTTFTYKDAEVLRTSARLSAAYIMRPFWNLLLHRRCHTVLVSPSRYTSRRTLPR